MSELDPDAAELALRLFPLASSWCAVCNTRLQQAGYGRQFRLFCRVCKKWRRGRSTLSYPRLPVDPNEQA